MSRNICIKYKEYDLLRIIPMQAEDDYDFKIEFMKNEFKLRLFPVGKEYYDICESVNLPDYSITYHKQTDNNSAKFHLKSKDKKSKYFDFPITNILDPTTSSTFPIPLMRLKINQNSEFKKFKRKNKNFNFDLDENNILEIYLVNKTFDFEDFMRKWSIFNFLYMVAPMDYFVHGKVKSSSHINKYKSIYENISLKGEVARISKDISMQFISYKNKNFYNGSTDSFIDIFENGEYLKYLFFAPINYYDSNGNKTFKLPAYIHQLNRGTLNSRDKKILKKKVKKFSDQIKGMGKELDGFSLEMG